MEGKDSAPKSKGNKVLVVVGPSGVGKDTLMQRIFDKYPNIFKKGVTHTSRKMRPGEKEGYNYYYVTKEEFLKLKEKGGLVEHNFYNGNYYGLSKKELEDGTKGEKILYVIIDINGAKSVHDLKIPSNFVAILPPNEEILEERLKGRGTESAEVIKGRLDTAKTETRRINEADFFDYKVYNDELDKAVLEMEKKLKQLYPNIK
jgi:guanylate kinase